MPVFVFTLLSFLFQKTGDNIFMSSPSSSSIAKLGFWSATSVIIGSIIGSGIFKNPSEMAGQVGAPFWLILVWVIAGMFTFFGALVYAELGSAIPQTGGIYVYFRKMFGDFTAFLYGWAAFSVINTAAVAAIAFVCAFYANHFLQLPQFDATTIQATVWHLPFIGDLYPLQDFGVKLLAIALIIIFTLLNYWSTKAGGVFQLFSTIVKIAVLVLLIGGIFMSGQGSLQNISHSGVILKGGALLAGIIAAMTGAFFSYDGWINIASMAGEIKQPQKNIPRSLLLGVLVCIVVYVLVNLAYLYALPIENIAASQLVASDAATVTIGATGASIVAALIVICTLGALNGNTMACCRITYAMGKDKLFASWAGKDSKYKTPGNALWLHGIWTSVFIITGSFDMLANMFVFITWIAYGLGAVGLFWLRRKNKELSSDLPQNKTYKMWGHPFITLLFIGFTAFYLIMTVYSDVTNYMQHRQPVINSVLGLIITSLGVPLYFYFKRKNKCEASV